MISRPPSGAFLCLVLVLAILFAVLIRHPVVGPAAEGAAAAPSWLDEVEKEDDAAHISVQMWVLQPRHWQASQEEAVAEMLRAQSGDARPPGLFDYSVTLATIPVDGSAVTQESLSAATVLSAEGYLERVIATPIPGT